MKRRPRFQVGYLRGHGYPVFACEVESFGDGIDLLRTDWEDAIEGYMVPYGRVDELRKSGLICGTPKKALGVE